MIFSSSLFLFFFLPILLIAYFCAGYRYRNYILLIASLFFYAWGEPRNILLMLLSIFVNYLTGIGIERNRNHRKLLLAVSLAYNLGILYIFKYLNFSADVLNRFAGTDIELARIALPIGISFFTFQIISYVFDVYRGTIRAQYSLAKLALYITLFPQLIAGPIVRYRDICQQIEHRSIRADDIYEGSRRFAVGFAKKILLADQLAPLADIAFSEAYPSLWLHWLGIIAYTLQIYFDFSGYSDMAIGLGRIFGFRFLENFNSPYVARSIQDFWRRWHISLSSWFRDYLYIPLGGSRVSNLQTYANLVIVFFFTGLWHGASFNFIAWGLFYAFFLILERLGLNKVLEKMPSWLAHAYALMIIMTAWVFFRADNLSAALRYLKGMVSFSGKDWEYCALFLNSEYAFFLMCGIFCAIPHQKLQQRLRHGPCGLFWENAFVTLAFVLGICYMIGSGYSPFLYFRF